MNPPPAFDLRLSADQEHLDAFIVRLPDGRAVAWAPYGFRVLRRQARALRSHLDLTDDVVSTLYGGRSAAGNAAAVFALANVPDWGLLQLYGGRAVDADPDRAVARARLGSARLVTALKGRFRQSEISALTVAEAAAFYRHLLACEACAALLGQPVRRLTGSAVTTDGVGQLVTADAQEQLETLVAGLEDVAYALTVVVDPYTAADINRLLQLTANELSRFASLVKGSDSLQISISPGALLTPVGSVLRQDARSVGISHVEQRSALETSAHELTAARTEGQTVWARGQESQEHFSGHTETRYAEGAHVTEGIQEHETAQVHLERDYNEQYALHRTYSATESGVMRDDSQRAAQQTGERHTDTRESGALQAHDSIQESTAGQRAGSGSRAETEAYSFGESARYGGSYHEESARTFSGTGGESREEGYQQAEWDAGTSDRGQTFTRAGENEVRGDGARLETFAGRETSGELRAGGMVPMAGGAQVEQHDVTGERGALYTARDSQQLTAAGSETTRQHEASAAVGGGARVGESDYQRDGAEAATLDRSWGGTEFRSGGGQRSSNTAYGYAEAYSDQHQTERDSARAWASQVEQDQGWQQQTREQAQGVTHFVKAYGGDYAESGDRSGHLVQSDQITADRAIQRTTDRSATGWRNEEQAGGVTRQQSEAGAMQMQQGQIAAAAAYQRRQAAGASGETGQFAGSGVTTTRGYLGPGGAGLFIGLGQSRQTLDAQREILTQLLQQQRDRLLQGLDTGLFRAQVTLLAPDRFALERVIGACLAAFREENVVVPVMVRLGDAPLRQATLAFTLDARLEPGAIPTPLYGQALTSNELAPLVHPVRVEGKGGVSTTLRAWPNILGLDRSVGELEWGLQISPTTGATTDLVYRVAQRELMHLLIVGSSGSGKSNAAIWLAAQLLNRVREDAQGRPLPVPTTGGMTTVVPTGRPGLGITVFDPTGEWRRLAQFVLSTEFAFHSLTDPTNYGLGFNPVAVPSPFITPKEWIGIFAKRWALAYATGATGVALMRRALRQLYAAHDVFDRPERARDLTLADLYEAATAVFQEMVQNRQVDNISPGILKRILDKMEEFLPGGLYQESLGRPGPATVETWLDPYRLTVLEGDFGDDEQLKSFVMGLLGMATYQHAANRYKALIKQQGTLAVRRHLLVFEEAHVVMAAGDKTEVANAVEPTAGMWDTLADRGRKYGLYEMAVGQHWLGFSEGTIGAAKLVIAQSVNTLDDAKAAVAALGVRPGTSAMDDVTQLLDCLLALPVGVGIVARKRLPKSQESQMKPVAVQFPDVSRVQPPTDAQLRYLLSNAAALTAQQHLVWQQYQTLFPQPNPLVRA